MPISSFRDERSGVGIALGLFSVRKQFPAYVDVFCQAAFFPRKIETDSFLMTIMSHLIAIAFGAPVLTATTWVGIVLYLNMVLPEDQD